MYSPKIHPTLIPILYRLGQHRRQPMTKLTSELILGALENIDMPEGCYNLHQNAKRVLGYSPALKEAA